MNLYDDDELKNVELLSTHPTHKNRAERLTELMPSVSQICPIYT